MEPSQSPVVVITGASSGIGEAVSRRLFGCGFHVVMAARRAERLHTLKRELEPALHTARPAAVSNKVLTVIADITIKDDRERLVSEALSVFRPDRRPRQQCRLWPAWPHRTGLGRRHPKEF